MSYNHYGVAAVAFLAVAVIVSVGVFGYDFAVSRIYGGLLGNTAFIPTLALTEAQRESYLEVAREGVRWAHRNHSEVQIWAATLLILAVLLVGLSTWFKGSFKA